VEEIVLGNLVDGPLKLVFRAIPGTEVATPKKTVKRRGEKYIPDPNEPLIWRYHA
jgi:hypothetical protein